MKDILIADQEQMQQIPISLTFAELQSFACEDVATASISQETALEICKRSLQDLDAKIVDVLSLWLQKLLRAYFNEAECCVEVFKCLYEWFNKLKAAVSAENKTACDEFIILLTDALSYAEWAKDKLLKASERLVHTTLFFLFSIVNGYLQQSIECGVDALREHEPKAIDLHMMVLQLLKQVTASSSKVHARITPLLRQLIEIADFLGAKMSHLVACVKTSKTMTNICTHYSGYVNLSHSMPDWLQETALHLCDTVLNNLETVYNQTVPVDKLEEYFKVSQAYLIMLHKLLSCGVQHMDKSVLDTLILLLIGGESRQIAELDKDIPLLVAKYIKPYVLQVFELIYQLEDFQNYLMAYLTAPEQAQEDYFELCLDYITVIIIDNTEISSLSCQTVQKLFEYLFRDAANFTNAERYNRILEAFGSLLHVADSLILFKYFLTGQFQEDLVKSQVCADVLMICFRLEEANQNWSQAEITQAMNYYMKCNNLYALFSQNPSQWHIQRMLKYFHKLSNSKQPLFSIRNYRHLHCVSDRNEQDQQLWIMRLRRLLITASKDTEQYYEMLALMELLSMGQDEWPLLLLDSVNELIRSHKSKRLANIYFKACLKLSSASQQRISQEVMPTEEIVNSCWHVQKFYHSRLNVDPTIQIVSELLPILNDLYPPFGYRPSAETALHFEYHKLDYKPPSHRCNLSNLKRKRTDNESKDLLEQLELNSNDLQDYCGQLDSVDVLKLKNIINNLNRILPKC